MPLVFRMISSRSSAVAMSRFGFVTAGVNSSKVFVYCLCQYVFYAFFNPLTVIMIEVAALQCREMSGWRVQPLREVPDVAGGSVPGRMTLRVESGRLGDSGRTRISRYRRSVPVTISTVRLPRRVQTSR
jgi:hypothetical protein